MLGLLSYMGTFACPSRGTDGLTDRVSVGSGDALKFSSRIDLFRQDKFQCGLLAEAHLHKHLDIELIIGRHLVSLLFAFSGIDICISSLIFGFLFGFLSVGTAGIINLASGGFLSSLLPHFGLSHILLVLVLRLSIR